MTEIGLRSLSPVMIEFLGTGAITAIRHVAGVTPVVSDKFTILATTPEIAEAQSLNMQYGISSLPDDDLPTLASSVSITSLLYAHERLFLFCWLFSMAVTLHMLS